MIEQARAYCVRRADRLPTVGVGASASRAPTAGSITNTYSVGFQHHRLRARLLRPRATACPKPRWRSLPGHRRGRRKTVQMTLIAAVANTYLSLLADDALLR
jgi:multidrug efflux system outer membrane protein